MSVKKNKYYQTKIITVSNKNKFKHKQRMKLAKDFMKDPKVQHVLKQMDKDEREENDNKIIETPEDNTRKKRKIWLGKVNY